MTMAASTTAVGAAMASSRVTGLISMVALAVCSCGRGALGFVLPSTSTTSMAAPRATRAERARGAVPATLAAATAAATLPRAAFRLYAGERTDFMDSIGGVGRELSTEEKIAALQKEVQAQAAMAAEADETEEDSEDKGLEVEGKDGMEIPAVKEEKSEEDDSAAGGLFSKDEDFSPEEGFVDEGKNILWPNPRRAAQLTLLAVVAQIAFIVYIISLNSLLNALPEYFQKLVDLIKAGDISQVRLPDL